MSFLRVNFLVALLALAAVLLSSTIIHSQPVTKVLVVPVVSAPLQEKLPLSGTLISPKSSELTTRVNGYVEKLYVDVGDKVNQGDLLLVLDSKIAKLESQRITAAHEEAKVLYRDAERLVKEARELVKGKHISQTEYESRQARADAARSNVLQLGAQRAIQAEQLNRHTLKAPFSGVIAAKLTEVGQWVKDDSPVLRLAQMDPLYLEARVPERFYGRFQPGTKVMLDTQGLEASRNALVDRVVPVSDLNTRTFLVRAVVENTEWMLLPGMSVKAEFELSNKQDIAVLQVPVDVVVRKSDGSTLVWAVRNGEQGLVAQPVNVTLGRSVDSLIEIRSSQLKPGDQVVILGNESLRPGQAVQAESAG